MRKLPVAVTLVALPALGLSMLAGCSHTVHEDKTVKTRSDGTQVKSVDKTVQNPDGSVTHTRSQSVDH